MKTDRARANFSTPLWKMPATLTSVEERYPGVILMRNSNSTTSLVDQFYSHISECAVMGNDALTSNLMDTHTDC